MERKALLVNLLQWHMPETGNKVDSIKGYFLEPETDYNRAKVKNSDTSIAQGHYKVIPKTKLEERINA